MTAGMRSTSGVGGSDVAAPAAAVSGPELVVVLDAVGSGFGSGRGSGGTLTSGGIWMSGRPSSPAATRSFLS